MSFKPAPKEEQEYSESGLWNLNECLGKYDKLVVNNIDKKTMFWTETRGRSYTGDRWLYKQTIDCKVSKSLASNTCHELVTDMQLLFNWFLPMSHIFIPLMLLFGLGLQ